MSAYPRLEACVAAYNGGELGKARDVVSSGWLELVYFAGPGRGELTRSALRTGGVNFKDTRILCFQGGVVSDNVLFGLSFKKSVALKRGKVR